MKPLSRRRSLFALAAVLGSGCLYLGGIRPTQSRTEVRSADLDSTTPPLAAFVIRLAASDESLDDEQARKVHEIAEDAEASIRPVDDARTVFRETLVRAVTNGRFDEDATRAAAANLVAATRTAAMRLLHALTKLHGTLEPPQRRALVGRVEARFSGWAPAWQAGSYRDHPWLRAFGLPVFPENDLMIEDTVRTARRWADATSDEVKDALARPLDDAARRTLLERLRS